MSYNAFPVKKVIKRDGRIVDFDEFRIREAVRKAMVHVNMYDEATLKKVVEHTLKVIAEKFGEEKIPHVEDIQDIVELTLVKFDLYEVAKAYILYRKEREKIREEKKRILEKEYVDEVDKVFSVNALRLMASRYLLRDEKGKLKEGPKEMFKRVAALIVIPDILFDPEIYDKNGGQPIHPKEDFDIDFWDGKLGLGRKNNGELDVKWNKWHLDRMKYLYDELNSQGFMKVSWTEFLKMLMDGFFEKYYRNYLEYYKLMVEKKFMPNSPTLFNAGTRLNQLSACFVLDIDDNIESIMDASKEAAIIFKSGGGVGINYSKLRPEGDLVFSTYGVASGPVSFMRIIDTVTEVVKQGGKRRGANMGILEVWHPDIETFIHSKEKEGFLENFNISVMITPDFWRYYYERKPYPLKNPRDGSIWKTIDPVRLFREIAEAAWRTADPGVLFLDNINRYNPFRESLGDIRATNPCGEQPLYYYESCNLGSINLYAFVKKSGDKNELDWDSLREGVEWAVKFLDNVIDVNKYPLEQIEYKTKKSRRIGLGLMGIADMLFALGIPYNSEEGFQMMSRVMEFIAFHAYRTSIKLADERGTFQLYSESNYSRGVFPIEGFYHPEWWTLPWDKLAEELKKKGLRNSHVTTVAPTGSISMLLDVSSGLEPQFALVYEKRVTVGTFFYTDIEFEKQLKEHGLLNEYVLKKVADNGGSVQGLEEIPEDFRKVFLVAYDIPWWDHIRAQYEIQKWVDASVSKTINMPAWVTVEDVMKAYLFAYKLGLKGVTIYRDTSKSVQVLVTPSQKTNKYIALTPNKTLELMKQLGIEPPTLKNELRERHFEKEVEKPGMKLILSELGGSEITVEQRRRGEVKTTSMKLEKCPFCESVNLAYQEGCAKCLDCGWANCVTS
ncbi:MAG: adenosylcobalamin-dependent ribonucleoside-diphosphate reductase [Aigarchaeota archaeon]|nr:adenosylcobalamin-dependent ribonucleoside-diphosphate reductase [Aigarchaeota archaeon]MCX8193095.1 adenosylcobalamin-dependent ribonucleoside-diphosphate reductase [Nitrososphaeria archaeon]MDW7986944.1 adenosylcobalamin-dependent ribonucleoside-diphosphate reductase [Nitrososphaerota archaeon]